MNIMPGVICHVSWVGNSVCSTRGSDELFIVLRVGRPRTHRHENGVPEDCDSP